MLFSSVIFLNSCMNSILGATTPMFPGTGSIIIHAISPLFFSIVSFTESILLYSHTRVCFTVSTGTPGLVGTLNVSVPEPDLTSKQSECPW